MPRAAANSTSTRRAHPAHRGGRQRINRQHGTHTVTYAEQIGLGSQHYTLVSLDSQTGIDGTRAAQSERYNVYSLDGKKLLTNASSLDGLTKGTYIINGEKVVIE